MTFRARRVGIVMVIVIAAALGVAVVRVVQHGGAAAQHEPAVYYCPMHPGYTSDRPGDCPICSMTLIKRGPGTPPAAGKKIVYWTDPMMPGYRSDKPGTSPMGMPLVPVYEGGGDSVAGYATVSVTPQRQQLIGVKTVTAERRAMTKTIRTVGRIAYDPELYQAETEYLQAVRARTQARATSRADVVARAEELVEASRLRLQLMGLSRAAIEEMAGWSGPDQRLLLTDPRGGVWLYAPVYEFELPMIEVGQTITADLQAIPGARFDGTVRSIDPIVDAMTRTARVRAELTDPRHLLKPGMFVNASLLLNLGERLVVPEEAVLATGTRHILFVDKGEGRLEPRDVVVGARADGFVEILDGVIVGERVVTNGNFLIDSESRLEGALQAMAPPPATPPEADRHGRPKGPEAGGGVGEGTHQHGQ